MKQIFFILSLITLFVSKVTAQDYTYIHDEAKYAGIALKLTGSGDVSSYPIYNANGNYVKQFGSPRRNYATQMSLTLLYVKDEPDHADSIKANLKKRSIKSLEKVAEYSNNLVSTGAGIDNTIEKQLDEAKERVSMLKLYGCSEQAYQHYNTYYELLDYRQKQAGKGYQPSNQRKQIYTKLYDDAVAFNQNLRKVLLMYYTNRTICRASTDPNTVLEERMKRKQRRKEIIASKQGMLTYYALKTLPGSTKSGGTSSSQNSGLIDDDTSSSKAKAVKTYFFGN